MFKFGFRFGFVGVALRLIGDLFVRLFCMQKNDLKSLIVYFTVAHMVMVIGHTIMLSYWGVCKSFALMVVHGLSSSGLLCVSNISYKRFGRLSLLSDKDLINLMPTMTIWWFFVKSL